MMSASGAPAPNTVWLAFRYRSQPLQPSAAAASVSRSSLSGTNSAAACFAMGNRLPRFGVGHALSRRPDHLREVELPALDDVETEPLRHLVGGRALQPRSRIQRLSAF